MNVFGPEVSLPRTHYHRRRTRAEMVNGEPLVERVSSRAASLDEFSLTKEMREVYVVRMGKHVEEFMSKQDAVNRFAELALDRVK